MTKTNELTKKVRFPFYEIAKKSILSVCLISSFAFGQSLTPIDTKVIHEKNSRPALGIEVEPSTDLLKSEWIDFMSKKHDLKLKGNGFLTNKDVLFAEKVVVSDISPKALNFYTEIIKGEDGKSSMKVFAAFGYDIFINKTDYPQEYEKLKNVLATFLNEYIPEYYTEQIEEAQDEVDDLKKSQKKLDKSISKSEKKIAKMTSSIEKLTKSNTEDKSELENVKESLKNYSDKLSKLKAKFNAL